MTTLLLARHGETEWNAIRRVQGWTDIPLSAHGLTQAQALAERLRQAPLTAVYASDLSRAAETARACAAAHGLDVHCLPELREKGFGDWEGLTQTQLEQGYPDLWRRYYNERDLEAIVPGGETWPEVRARMSAVLQRLLAAHPGADETVLVVGHGGSARALILEALHAPLPTLLHMHLDNASLSRLEFRSHGDSRVIFLNDTSHLSGGNAMTSLVLGLDGGGTQTRAAVATAEGTILGYGEAGACNLAAVSPADALANALMAADQALAEAGQSRAEIMALCAGVAGASFTERLTLFHSGLQAAFPLTQISVVPDYAIALTGATHGEPGVIVIAGTGSAAYGENAAGKSHKTGAYGYLIDDAGSGYGLGRAALAAVLRAADGTGEATTLSARIPSALGLSSLAEIIPGVYGGTLSRVTIAGLSRVVADAARDDADPVARALLMRAGGALAVLVQGITQRLFAETPVSPFPVIPIGSLWDAGDTLTDVFQRSLNRFAPTAVWTPALHPPVEGAIRRAIALEDATQKN